VPLKFVGRNHAVAPKTDRTTKGRRTKKKLKGRRRASAKVERNCEAPVSAKKARETVLNFLRSSALAVAKGMVNAARKGQLAHTKFLFEVTGIHPASEEAMASAPQELFIETLLRKANLPLESGAEQSSEGRTLPTAQPGEVDTVE
jgi:hypothetical protein